MPVDDDNLDDLDNEMTDAEAGDEVLDDETTLFKAIGKLLHGASDLWTHHGDLRTVRNVLSG